MLFSRLLKDQIRGKDIYCQVDEFLKTEGFEWKNCCGVCTDDAIVITSKNIDCKAFFQTANYDYIIFGITLFIGKLLQQKN